MKENTENRFYKRLTGALPGPHVLLTAGVHGDEYEPMLAACALMDELAGKLAAGRVTIVPIVNENAYERTNRCGDDGLDLARICPGNPDGSVSEKTADWISALIREADYYVDMHTGGLAYDIFPLAGYMLHPSPDVLEKQQQMAISYNLPIVWGTDFRPNGRTLSVARDANIPAIYLEYGGGTGLREPVVTAYKAGFLNMLKHLNLLDEAAETQPISERFWVEDHRPDSGYLQAKMPSPADGVFQAVIKPGERVRAGQLWGRIIDPVSGTQTDVRAEADGLAFLLRTVVKVKTGDALGGILPIDKPGKRIIHGD
ncbi:succinylglutamate desuccinylase/aspartoacylase family protein [Larkinella terrae]|uniref:Succinylglutamate desuccinylase n=1 Tax=Larkinella terrae TaxID=2025311 RepID=A0A7K0EQJ9_9BACT|nr:succinylglutamate desuccinylase/aspartoacylase family protein [Larkinella terrae]MRS64069.1 succinylglutamate desuccinylase [Larkinella terrae]